MLEAIKPWKQFINARLFCDVPTTVGERTCGSSRARPEDVNVSSCVSQLKVDEDQYGIVAFRFEGL